MLKKGEQWGSSWKSRFFRLEGDKLRYYASREDSTAKGEIDISKGPTVRFSDEKASQNPGDCDRKKVGQEIEVERAATDAWLTFSRGYHQTHAVARPLRRPAARGRPPLDATTALDPADTLAPAKSDPAAPRLPQFSRSKRAHSQCPREPGALVPRGPRAMCVCVCGAAGRAFAALTRATPALTQVRRRDMARSSSPTADSTTPTRSATASGDIRPEAALCV